ncbi:MAG: LLM class F420-dependent oxidoreductase [Acidimicrobiales bacterium]
MRFAIKTSPQNTTWDEMLAVWKAADDIELFESAWTFDHFEPIFSDRAGPCLEGWLTLTALAQATTRLRVGVLVTGVPYRHPAVLANMAATLDQISHGRLELGLGAGWNTDEAEAYGIDLLAIKDRMDRFDEACDVIISLLTQAQTTYDGAHYKLLDAYCEPKGIQQPHPPICIGGSGERRTLRTVARVAQHWNYVGGPVEEYVRLKGVIAEHCATFGRDPAEIMTSAHLRLDNAKPEAVADEAAAFAEAGLDLGIVYLPPPQHPAVLETVAEALAPLAG